MSEKTYIDLGQVTAYAYAKAHGYTGTEEEFAIEQAHFAQNAQQVAEDRVVVREDRTHVDDVVETFTETTAPEAVQRVTTEGDTQVARVQGVGNVAVQDVTDTKDQALQDIDDAGESEVNGIQTEGNTQVGRVSTEGTTQVGNVNTAGTTQVSAVNQAGNTQVGLVRAEGNTQVQNVEDKGQEIIDALPPNYEEDMAQVEDFLENLVKVSDTQPESEANKLWIEDQAEEEIEVPTYEEFESLSNDVSDAKNAISQNEEAIGELEKDVWDSFNYGFTDNVTSGVDYKGYANGKKVEVEIPINETFLLNVETNAFQKFTLYIRRENSQSFLAYGEYNTNTPVTITNSSSLQYKIVELTLWAKAADVTSTGSFAFNVSIDNPDGLAARMSTVETDITEIASEVEDIQAELSGIASYSITDNVTAGSEYKGYANGKKIEVEIPYDMPFIFRVDTECFTRYKAYVYTDDTTYYAMPYYSNVGEDNHALAGYSGQTYKKITLHVPRVNDLTQQDNITSSGTFTFAVSFKEETEYDIINLNPKSEMLSKIQNGRVSVEVSGRTGANRPKCLTLAHFSDIHADATNLSRVIEFCGEYTDYLDDIVCTGDLVRDHAINDGVEEDFTFWDDCGAENVLSVIGNHDTAAITNGTIDWRGFGQLNTYNKYFAPFIANWNVTQPQNASTVGKCYYYKDYSDYNIRLIVLDCMYYDQAQDDWFASVLESARTSSYAVIVCAHSIGKSGVGINCVFNSLIGEAGPVIVDTSTYIYNANVHTKVDAFISAGGTFICFLGGHFHKDHFGLVSDTVNPQPYILVDTAAYNAPLRDHAVVKFERSQDCFNFVSFDTTLHLIKIVRVGYQHDCWMREKNPIAYDYENHALI